MCFKRLGRERGSRKVHKRPRSRFSVLCIRVSTMRFCPAYPSSPPRIPSFEEYHCITLPALDERRRLMKVTNTSNLCHTFTRSEMYVHFFRVYLKHSETQGCKLACGKHWTHIGWARLRIYSQKSMQYLQHSCWNWTIGKVQVTYSFLLCVGPCIIVINEE